MPTLAHNRIAANSRAFTPAITHEESRLKGERVSKAWEEKRAHATERPLTRICPAWLHYDEENRSFIEIPGRSEIIQEIFELHSMGYGRRAIVCQLNDRGEKPWGRGKAWHSSYIKKILENPAVLGEFQPHKFENGVRVLAGEPITDYFPRIISDTVFHNAQKTRAQRNHNSASGRRGSISNLFTRIARCGYCGSAMTVIDKGKPPKGRKYFICSTFRTSSRSCKIIYFHYEKFERAMLGYCSELNFQDILPAAKKTANDRHLADLQNELTEIQLNVEILEDKIENWEVAIGYSSDQPVQKNLLEKANIALVEKNQLLKKEGLIQIQIENMSDIQKTTEERIDGLKQLQEAMNSKKGTDLIELRTRLRTYISGLIKRINFYPAGISVSPDVVDLFERRGTDLIQLDLVGEQYKEDDVSDLKARILSRLKGRDAIRILVEFNSGVKNLITYRRDGLEEFVLRANNIREIPYIEDIINFEDNQGLPEYWGAIQDVLGINIELALASEISIWKSERQKATRNN